MSIDRAGVRPFPLHNLPTDHIMITITAKQNAPERFESATDWMASFLDVQISKLEERGEDVPPSMLREVPKAAQDPIWN